MSQTTFDQECHLSKKNDTWIIIIKKKNHSKIKPFLDKKIDVEITLTTKSD